MSVSLPITSNCDKKADGSRLRLVNDYELLSAKTIDDLYPMANLNEIISKAAGKPFISKIDLSKAFLRVPLRAEDQEYTARSCHLGTLCWTRMAQGLSNSQGPCKDQWMHCYVIRHRMLVFCLMTSLLHNFV